MLIQLEKMSANNKHYECKGCRREVTNRQKSIQCNACFGWIHYKKCSSLTSSEFQEHDDNPKIIWKCSFCIIEKCKDCPKFINNKAPKIKCTCCKLWAHKSCAKISNDQYKDKSFLNNWICRDCLSENMAFSNLDNIQIKRELLSESGNNSNGVFRPFCNVCKKNNIHKKYAIPCRYCNCLIHKGCTQIPDIDINMHDKGNFMCFTCRCDAFSFTGIQNNELKELEFNSSCKYDYKSANDIINDIQLNINEIQFNENTEMADNDIDNNLVQPKNFKFYSTHTYNKMRENMHSNCTNTLSIFHTNIESLNKKFDDLQFFLDNCSHEFDIIMLTETWNDI